LRCAGLFRLFSARDAARARVPVVHAHVVEALAHRFIAGRFRHELGRRLPELDMPLRFSVRHFRSPPFPH
jgi:hypothetical protein